MKIVIYDNDSNIVNVIESIRSPAVYENNIEWEDGSLRGIKLPFLLLDDAVEVGESITDGIILLDKKSEFTKFDEVAELKAKLETVQGAVDFIIMNY